jgi:hypothetical protein
VVPMRVGTAPPGGTHRMPSDLTDPAPMRMGDCPYCERPVLVYEEPPRCPICACPLDEASMKPFAPPRRAAGTE